MLSPDLINTHTNWSLIGLISSTDVVGKLILAILLGASIWSWSIIMAKYLSYRRLYRKMIDFEQVFWSGQLLETLYEQVKRITDPNPLSMIFITSMREFKRPDNKKINSGDAALQSGLKERLINCMNLARQREAESMERGLTNLATIGSSTPFIGLFGMVWGVMNSFQDISATQNSSLAVVAPGIAEALFITAVGLFTAIPAVIYYNLLISKVDHLTNKIDDFILELYTILARAIDEGKV